MIHRSFLCKFMQIYFPYSNFCLSREWASLDSDRFYFKTLTDVPYQMTVGGAFVYVYEYL